MRAANICVIKDIINGYPKVGLTVSKLPQSKVEKLVIVGNKKVITLENAKRTKLRKNLKELSEVNKTDNPPKIRDINPTIPQVLYSRTC